jgi:hypothetical protein
VLSAFFTLIVSLLSCYPQQNIANNPTQMKELTLANAEIIEISSPDQKEETYYQFNFTYSKKLRNALFYYQQHSGKIEESNFKDKHKVLLTKKHHELPRSVYPLLTQGYIVVQFNWLGLETYQVIKDFKKSEARGKND